MTGAGRALDHVVLAGPDLAAAAARYEALGFTLTPQAWHDDRMGTTNRLAQFPGRTFVELLEVDRPAGLMDHGAGVFGFGAWNRDYVAVREGASMIVFRTENARDDIARWRALGIDTYDPFDFERQAATPEGDTVTVGFSLGFATSPEMPELAVFACEQRAPEHFWKPAYQEHPNGARDLAGVVLVADDPARTAGFFGRLFGGAVEPVDGGASVACGPHRIEVLTPEATRARDPGWNGEPGEGALAAGLLVRGEGDGRPVVPAAEANGAFIQWSE
jgi:hypothetical protein